MAHLKAEEHREPGTEQNVDWGRSTKWSSRNILWRRVWFGRMTFTEVRLSGGEVLAEV